VSPLDRESSAVPNGYKDDRATGYEALGKAFLTDSGSQTGPVRLYMGPEGDTLAAPQASGGCNARVASQTPKPGPAGRETY
jgi:hypothetical protein